VGSYSLTILSVWTRVRPLRGGIGI